MFPKRICASASPNIAYASSRSPPVSSATFRASSNAGSAAEKSLVAWEWNPSAHSAIARVGVGVGATSSNASKRRLPAR
jgi:hypothetical protein